MKASTEFIVSAAGTSDFPHDGLFELALVGRSNVGKSSLINALVRQRVARTSSAPGKTRLANIYRVSRVGSSPIYLVDLPGYGYARGGRDAAQEFAALTRSYFSDVRNASMAGHVAAGAGTEGQSRRPPKPGQRPVQRAGLLLVDARHPGLESDLEAWEWLKHTVDDLAVVATKFDKLTQGARSLALRNLKSAFEDDVLPVSAVTGEGLDELWKLIDRLANSRNRNPHSKRRRHTSHPLKPEATAPPHLTKS